MQPTFGPPSLMVAIVLATGVFAFWLAEKFGWPDALVALGFGHVLSFGLTENPAALETFRTHSMQSLGICVAIVFFMGGQSLGLRPLGEDASAARHLVGIGSKLGWVAGTVVAAFVLGLSWELAFLCGALLMVGAPYLSQPLSARLRVPERLALVLHWESFALSCLGVVWSVLTCGAVVSHSGHPSLWATISATTLMLVAGLGCGGAASFLTTRIMKSRKVSPRLENAMVLSLVALSFGLAQSLYWGAGLVATITLGYATARTPESRTDANKFWETAGVLSLSTLAVCVGILMPLGQVAELGWRGWVLALLMASLVRPLLVLLATRKTKFERRWVGAMMLCHPSGILALAVTAMITRHAKEFGVDTGPMIGVIYCTVLVSVLLPWFAGSRILDLACKAEEVRQT